MKSKLFGHAFALGILTVCGGAEFRSADIRLDKPLGSGFLAFSDNIRRFDVKLTKPMDLSSAAGLAFQVKCADPQVLTDCWLLFKTGDGYYRASFPVPPKADTWTSCTVLKRDVRLYHWNAHISLHEVFVKPDPGLLPDWSRVTEFQIVLSLVIDRTTRDGAVAVRDFAALDAGSPAAAAAVAASDTAENQAFARVAAHPPARPGRRFLATHVWGLDWNWDATCRMLKEGGVTDIIPLMTYGGYAYYGGSKIEIPSPLIDAHGDPLKLCLAACRKYGLKCHVWRSCWGLSTESSKAFVDMVRSDGRLQVSFGGESERWFCPTHPANVRREIDGLLELSALGADGIMLDYFRYPDADHCFCPRCRARFEKSLGRTVADWPAGVRSDAELAKRWSAFRRDLLTDVLRTIRTEVRRRAPQLEVSAAVAATVEGADARGQDWPAWCRAGLLDRLFPMCYNSTSKLLRRDLETLIRIVGGTPTKLTPMTCFACGDIPFLSLDEICRQIDTVQSFGRDGDLAFFRLTEYAPYVLEALRKGPLAESAGDRNGIPPGENRLTCPEVRPGQK